MKDGNLTTAAVVFDVSSKDNGSHLTCRASNPAMRGSVLMESRELNVFCESHLLLKNKILLFYAKFPFSKVSISSYYCDINLI